MINSFEILVSRSGADEDWSIWDVTACWLVNGYWCCRWA